MNQTTKIILGIIAIALIVWGVYAYNQPKEASGEPIEIGFVGPLSGDAVTYGEPMRNAVELAVADVNANGGVNGRPLSIIYEDGQCSGGPSTSAAQKLINVDGVKFIIGGFCSGEALAIVPVAAGKNVLVLSPTASSPDLTGINEFFFRNNPSDSSGGKVLAEKMLSDGHKRIAIITERTDFATAFEKVFVNTVREGGGEIVVQESFAPETGDFRTQLSKISTSNPDGLVINPQTEIAGGNIIKQARELGLNVPLYGSISMAGSTVREIAGSGAEGLVVTDNPNLEEGDQRAEEFLASFRERYGDTAFEFYLAASYDAVHILRDAMEEVGIDAVAVRNHLDSLENYRGVIGTYEFDENGDLAGVSQVLKRVENGELVLLEQ